MRLFGKKINRLTVLPVGFDIEYSRGRSSYLSDIVIALAGPLINLAAAAICSAGSGSLTYRFIGINLGLCLFNLLPVHPLDGGRALYLALEWILGPDRGQKIFSVFSCALTIILLSASLLNLIKGKNIWISVIFTFVFLRQKEIIGYKYKSLAF